MKAAMIGCGRLGLPVALAMATKHKMVGYDVSPAAAEIVSTRKYPHREPGAQRLLDDGTSLRIVGSVDEAVAFADLVFVAVQTPHGPEYEGITRMPEKRADFDYSMLKDAVRGVAESAARQRKRIVLVVISTVLPGTSERELYPLLNEYTSYVYNPSFIAQSTVVEDFLRPEFVLLGCDDKDSIALAATREFYRELHGKEHAPISVKSAELAKVGYNVLLGLKLVAANTLGEIAHKTGANADEVTDALAMATDRVVSAKYMRAGMSDGGGCFVEGELIHVEDGVRPIEEIEKGDRVLGGDGKYHEVLETYRRPYKGKVYTIKGRGLTRFTVTGEHPVHVAADLRTVHDNGRRRQDLGPQLGPVAEVPADRIGEDCYIAFPAPRDETPRAMWSPAAGKTGPGPRPVFTDGEEYVRLAGYYLSEGSIWFDRAKNGLPSRVQFSFNSTTDAEYVTETVTLLGAVCPGARVRVDRHRENCANVIINSTQLARSLDHDFGHGCEEKHIPGWILNNDRNSALCLRGMFRGDGSSGEDGFSFSTVSPQLAHGASLMLRRHGISSALQYYGKRTGTDGVVHRAAYDLDVRNACYIPKLVEIVGMPIRHKMQEKQYPNVIFERDGIWYHRVNAVETSEYEGTVYNLNVADVHNYVSVGGLVSNCHPRDQIALSWLAKRIDLSFDLFGAMVHAREQQTEWLGSLAIKESEEVGLPIVLLGKAYKKGTNLTVGSPAILLAGLLRGKSKHTVSQWDPYVDGSREFQPSVFVVATDHDEFYSMPYPAGSVVIDPWGKFSDREGVRVIRVGRH